MESGIFQPGTSRHQAKNDARQKILDAGDQATSHAISSKIGIHSYSTFEKYKDIWHSFARFCRSEMNLKDLLKVGVEHVHEYLEHRAVVDQVSWRTFQLEAAALNKWDDAVRSYCEKQGLDTDFDFSRIIAEAKIEFRDLLDNSASPANRAYDHPESIRTRIENNNHKLAWQMALEGGGRISEISLVRENQLQGVQRDPYTGKDRGVIAIKGKGGLVRPLSMTPETYRLLEARLDENNGLLQINQNSLRSSVRAAADGDYKGRGIHGARYNYAQNRYVELTRLGCSHEQTISLVSRELGHRRPDITMRYLAM